MHSLRPTSPPQGFRVNIIAPWFIATNIVSEGMRKQLEEAGLQFAAAEDAAKATLRFASDASLNGA
jgi:NAD(P)-dependent dehydrogenase (short-subunit alcohol dehydrogenase family)